MRAQQLLGADGPFARAMPGYELRSGQLDMAEAVQRTLDRDGVLLTEAGTGTGKTLAYLVPALLSGKKVVVSTGTKTLQDQIMEHDLPLLREHLDIPVEAACMKGLNNYLCLRRYHELLEGAAADEMPGGTQGSQTRWLPVLQQWEAETESGDHAELEGLPEGSSLWSAVQSGSDTRIGAKCRFYDACYVTRMKQQAQEAQLVIVNHHLFFADLATRGPHGGGVIPDYDAVIFDEAHQIEDVATDFFGISVSTTRLERLVRDARKSLLATKRLQEAEPLLKDVLLTTSHFFSYLPRPSGIDSGRVPLPAEAFTDRVRQPMLALDDALEGLASYAKRHASEHESVAQIARRAQKVRDDVACIAEGDDASMVNWTQLRGRSVSIGASPVDVSDILRDQLFYTGCAVVMTSATLSTAGSFEFIRRRLGVDIEAEELQVLSPFDYAQQAALYVPAELPDPRDAAFGEQAAGQVLQLAEMTAGGAFVLCTSIRNMRELHERCRGKLPGPALLQGEAPKATLLQRFRAAGNATLFATASFWQGVDVPGDALRLVVIDKLPFDVPTDPLVAARCELLKQDGVSPFMKYLVPAAALTLKQGFGRLIRTQRDRGIVAVLDRRLRTKGYGKVFLRSLPEARHCRSLDEVATFWGPESKPVTPRQVSLLETS